ncbi:cysteine dioxygenase [Sphingomonas nostoxanthinifaciens]|nr:cysteine dioxygenase [Sphingomonas nostoxanthinifaciens]
MRDGDLHDRLSPLRRFISDFTELVDGVSDKEALLDHGGRLLGELLAAEGWLPESHARPDPDRYRQYLLYADPAGRFSVVSFVWGPGQATPVHDHTVWGLVGVLSGAEISERFAIADGELRSLGKERLGTGAIDRLDPAAGDIHRVSNAYDDAVSISIHVYGADIGTVERSIYDMKGQARPFVSAYAPAPDLPF